MYYYFCIQQQVSELKAEVDSLTDQTKILRAAQISYSEDKIPQTIPNNVDSSNEELEKYKNHISDLEKRLSDSLNLIQELQSKTSDSKATADLANELKQQTKQFEDLKKDQEDLLVLLTDQDNKLIMYKERLTALGEKVSTLFSCCMLDVYNCAIKHYILMSRLIQTKALVNKTLMTNQSQAINSTLLVVKLYIFN